MSFLFLPLSKGMPQLGHVSSPSPSSNSFRMAAKSEKQKAKPLSYMIYDLPPQHFYNININILECLQTMMRRQFERDLRSSSSTSAKTTLQWPRHHHHYIIIICIYYYYCFRKRTSPERINSFHTRRPVWNIISSDSTRRRRYYNISNSMAVKSLRVTVQMHHNQPQQVKITTITITL